MFHGPFWGHELPSFRASTSLSWYLIPEQRSALGVPWDTHHFQGQPLHVVLDPFFVRYRPYIGPWWSIISS